MVLDDGVLINDEKFIIKWIFKIHHTDIIGFNIAVFTIFYGDAVYQQFVKFFIIGDKIGSGDAGKPFRRVVYNISGNSRVKLSQCRF